MIPGEQPKSCKTIMSTSIPAGFGLILIGDELLSGRRADQHMPKVIAMLAARGQHLSWVRCIGDEPERIVATLKDAFASGDIVFSCGGIGATPDDHTRQSAARALGVPLELNPQARDLITDRMKDIAREQGKTFDANSPDNQQRLNMGVFPRGAEIIPNPYNRIPGFSLRDVHFLPGFPVMAWPMMEWVLDERYARTGRMPVVRPHEEIALIVKGTGEAHLTPLMEGIEREFPGVKVFSLPSVDHPVHGAHIELGVKGEPLAARKAYEALQAGLRGLGAAYCPKVGQ